jgi:hypothetical protein
MFSLTFSTRRQVGDLVITLPGSYHSGFSHGYSIAVRYDAFGILGTNLP